MAFARPLFRAETRRERSRRYAVVDVETTGFDPRVDRVVEMACVVLDDGAVVSSWSTLVDPLRPIPFFATRVHGIGDADVAGAPRFARAQRQLAARCAEAIVVAHNAAFDLGFLPKLAARPLLCTLALARRAFPDAPNHKNQTLRAYLNIELGAGRPVVAHRALDDALVTAQVLLRCLDRLEGEAVARGA